jgi:hypothetical protein
MDRSALSRSLTFKTDARQAKLRQERRFEFRSAQERTPGAARRVELFMTEFRRTLAAINI